MKTIFLVFFIFSCTRLEIPLKPQNVDINAYYNKKQKIWEYRTEEIELLWNLEGTLIRKAYRKNQLYDGEYINYFENGIIAEKGIYREGYRIGKWFFYFPNGNLYLEIEYSQNSIESNPSLLNSPYGNESGKYLRYYPNGTKEEEGFYFAGKLHQKRIRYYPDGSINFIGFYHLGKKENQWEFYYKKKLTRKEFYKDDQLLKVIRY